MSRTHVELRWGVVVADPDHWTSEHLAQADAEPGGGYEDWVRDRLAAVMAEAGNQWIRDHPDLVDGDLL